MSKKFLKSGIIALCAIPPIAGVVLTVGGVFSPQPGPTPVVGDYYVEENTVLQQSDNSVTFTLHSSITQPHEIKEIVLYDKDGNEKDRIESVEIKQEDTEITFTSLSQIQTGGSLIAAYITFKDGDELKTINNLIINPSNYPTFDVTVKTARQVSDPSGGYNVTFTISCTDTSNEYTIPSEAANLTYPNSEQIAITQAETTISGGMGNIELHFNEKLVDTAENLMLNFLAMGNSMPVPTAIPFLTVQPPEEEVNYYVEEGQRDIFLGTDGSATFIVNSTNTSTYELDQPAKLYIDTDVIGTSESIKFDGGKASVVFKNIASYIVVKTSVKIDIVDNGKTYTIDSLSITPTSQQKYYVEEDKRDIAIADGKATFEVMCTDTTEHTVNNIHLYDVTNPGKQTEISSIKSDVTFSGGTGILVFEGESLIEYVQSDIKVKIVLSDSASSNPYSIEGLTLSPEPVVDVPFSARFETVQEQSDHTVTFQICLASGHLDESYKITKVKLYTGETQIGELDGEWEVTTQNMPKFVFDTSKIPEIIEEIPASLNITYVDASGKNLFAIIDNLKITKINVFEIENQTAEYKPGDLTVCFMVVNKESLDHTIGVQDEEKILLLDSNRGQISSFTQEFTITDHNRFGLTFPTDKFPELTGNLDVIIRFYDQQTKDWFEFDNLQIVLTK